MNVVRPLLELLCCWRVTVPVLPGLEGRVLSDLRKFVLVFVDCSVVQFSAYVCACDEERVMIEQNICCRLLRLLKFQSDFEISL